MQSTHSSRNNTIKHFFYGSELWPHSDENKDQHKFDTDLVDPQGVRFHGSSRIIKRVRILGGLAL